MHIRFSYFELCEIIADNTVHNTRMLTMQLTIRLSVKHVCSFAL